MRRVLILTTTFYPDPSVGGVRMTQWARSLPKFGWEPMVLTRYYGHRATPELLAQHVHPGVRVEYFNPPTAAATEAPAQSSAAGRAGLKTVAKQKLGQLLGMGLAVPDAGISFWRSRGVQERALKAVEEFKPDLLVTTGPPHSNHDIGLWLNGQTKIPWVADFRDPYVIDERFKPRFPFTFMFGAHKRYIERIHREADLVTHAIPVAARYWRIHDPTVRSKTRILTNACASDLAMGRVEPDTTPGGRRSIRAIGQIGDDEALRLACAIASLVGEGLDLELRIVGHEPTTLATIRQLLGERLVHMKGVRHDLALRQVAGAHVLVNYLSEERSRHYLLSSKLFEYLATRAPVLEVNPTVPDRQVLRKLPDVVVLSNPTLDELKGAVRRALELGLGEPGAERRAFVQAHEWTAQVGVLAGWFEEVVSCTPPPPSAGEVAD